MVVDLVLIISPPLSKNLPLQIHQITKPFTSPRQSKTQLQKQKKQIRNQWTV